MTAVTIRPIDPSSPLLREWYDTLRSAYTEGHDAMWWESFDHLRHSVTHPHPRRTRFSFAAMEGGRCVGALEFAMMNDRPQEPVQLDLGVAPHAQGRGIGRELAEHARGLAGAYACSTLQTEVFASGDEALGTTRPGRFLLAQGFRVGIVEDRLLLDLPWDGRGDGDSPAQGVVVRSWSGACPQEYEVAWAALKQQMEEDHPVGDLTRGDTRVDVQQMRTDEQRMIDRGWILVRSIALLRDHPVGFTEMYFDRDEPAIVVQDSTLVDRAARGRGVGRALKAANLRQLAQLPSESVGDIRHVQTWTAQSNAPMQQLNEQFGFRKVGTMHDAELTL